MVIRNWSGRYEVDNDLVFGGFLLTAPAHVNHLSFLDMGRHRRIALQIRLWPQCDS